MTDHADLITRLEAATEGSRELDFACALEIGTFRIIGEEGHSSEYAEALINGIWVYVGSERQWEDYWLPHYTTSLDAALTLVPEGFGYVISDGDWAAARATIARKNTDIDSDEPQYDVRDASSPALAICIAALKARDAARREDGHA